MTPKQKALELWTSYRALLSLPDAPLRDMKDNIAKQCALYTVSQIEEALDSDEDSIQNLDMAHRWWSAVRQEINNL